MLSGDAKAEFKALGAALHKEILAGLSKKANELGYSQDFSDRSVEGQLLAYPYSEGFKQLVVDSLLKLAE